MFSEDWEQISNHVGTRTKEQCIVKFLKLPIEDRFLEGAAAGGSDVGPLKYLKALGDKEDNPVMSVVAFLASAVDPEVAAKAAGDAIEQLEKSLRKKVEKKEENGTEEDAMEVEGGAAAPTTNGHSNGEEEDTKNGDLEDKSTSDPRSNLQKAALVALGSAAAKAHALALEEDASLHSLVTSIVDAQVRKLDLKLKHFDELESLLELERRSMEQQKQEMFSEKAKMQKMMGEVMGLWQRAKQGQAGGISQQEIASVMSQSTNQLPRAQAVQNPGPPPTDQEGEALQLS